MNYADLTKDIQPAVMQAIQLINNPEIAPEIRQRNQEILLKEVGQAIYDKVYQMNAFDMEIPHTVGPGINDAHFGMAKVASDSVSTGQMPLDAYVTNFLQQTAAKAQQDAMINAKQSGKHPTVIRSLTGKENCKWCEGLAGTYTSPGADVFKRHSGCDCKITTQGYKSRNGELNNYKSSPENKSILASGGLRTEDAAQRAIEDALNAGNTAKAQQIVDSIQDPSLKSGLQGTIDAITGKKRQVKVDPKTQKITYV